MSTALGSVVGGGSNTWGEAGINEHQYPNFSTVLVPAQIPDPEVALITAIAAGFGYSLALGADGKVWFWGLQGGIGNPVHLPIQVAQLDSIIAIAAGHTFSLALRADGTVWSWGNNDYGQLGDGTTTPRESVAQVIGLPKIVAIAAGYGHGLAIDVSGHAWSWGSNDLGQLGDGSIAPKSVPVTVIGLDRVIAIDGGLQHTLALRADGTVWAWGANYKGQLGDGTTAQHGVAVPVPSLSRIVAIAAGDKHSLALTVDSTVFAWGINSTGQLGNDTTVDSPSPVSVLIASDTNTTVPLDQVVSISVGCNHNLALTATGEALAWGLNNSGRLCDGTEIDRHWPVPMVFAKEGVDGPDRVTAIAAGCIHSVAIVQRGRGWGWGSSYVMTSPEDFFGTSDAVLLEGMDPPKAIAAGAAHSLGITGSSGQNANSPGGAGYVFAWGGNNHGQTDPTDSSGQPVGIHFEDNELAIAIAGGRGHSLCLLPNGYVKSWGANDKGQAGGLGVATPTPQPLTKVKGPGGDGELSGIKAIAAGLAHSLVLTARGRVWAWGANHQGQVGDGSFTDRAVPHAVLRLVSGHTLEPLSDIVAIAAGGNFSLALGADGTVWAWGSNDHGQLTRRHGLHYTARPISVYTSQGDPVKIKAIAAGLAHGLALTADGNVQAWGGNLSGQLGDGTTADKMDHGVPVNRGSAGGAWLTNVKAIAAGGGHSLALLADGHILPWGDNSDGQLGIGNKLPFVYVPDEPVVTYVPMNADPIDQKSVELPRVAAIAAGGFHSLAIGPHELKA